METHHLYHLAACWSARHNVLHSAPLTTSPVIGTYVPAQQALAAPGTVIRAAAAQMIFASRTSQDFISPEQVRETEKWTGKVGRYFRRPLARAVLAVLLFSSSFSSFSVS